MRPKYSLCGALFLGACASSPQLKSLKYEFQDQPAERQIELTYRNEGNETVCISHSHWPNSAGKMDQASDYVALIVDGQRYPIQSFNTGFCADCSVVARPGSVLIATISYEDFGVPDRLIDAEKTLAFSMQGFPCKGKP